MPSSGHRTNLLKIAKQTVSVESLKNNLYERGKLNFIPDFIISSRVLIGSSYPVSIRNDVRYAWSTVLLATLWHTQGKEEHAMG
jgi:hypothetical protein